MKRTNGILGGGAGGVGISMRGKEWGAGRDKYEREGVGIELVLEGRGGCTHCLFVIMHLAAAATARTPQHNTEQHSRTAQLGTVEPAKPNPAHQPNHPPPTHPTVVVSNKK